MLLFIRTALLLLLLGGDPGNLANASFNNRKMGELSAILGRETWVHFNLLPAFVSDPLGNGVTAGEALLVHDIVSLEGHDAMEKSSRIQLSTLDSTLLLYLVNELCFKLRSQKNNSASKTLANAADIVLRDWSDKTAPSGGGSQLELDDWIMRAENFPGVGAEYTKAVATVGSHRFLTAFASFFRNLWPR